MKTTIRANTGYRVHTLKDMETNEICKALYDGTHIIMITDVMTEEEMRDNLVNNEQFHLFEVFETVKGNKFAYCHDYEMNINYLVKLSDEVKK